MIRLILILALVFYVFYKVMSFFFRAGVASGRHQRQAPEGKKQKPNGNIKGGDYVDYEEVK